MDCNFHLKYYQPSYYKEDFDIIVKELISKVILLYFYFNNY